MDIRRLLPSDEESACEIARAFKCAQVDEAHMARFLADEENYLIAAYVGDEPAGFILAYELTRIDGARPKMFLYEIEVAAAHRRCGIGRALIAELKRICEERGVRTMFVFTEESNAAGMALYGSTGSSRDAGETVMFEYVFAQ